MNPVNEILRQIPQVEKILQEYYIDFYINTIGHPIVVKIIRDEIDSFRKEILAQGDLSINDLHDSIEKSCKVKARHALQRVINGTGIIMHTNLGRAPLGKDLFASAQNDLSGFCNLEYSIEERKRGKRGGFAEELICELTGAEDALIVNNNASSVFMILRHYARGKEVIVSRGELIQIGGGFRIPDIMAESDAHLVEVGTTNITTLDDYKEAVTENTSMVFSAHQSNYRMEGFSQSPELKDLASLKNDKILFVRDLGSGNLVKDDELKNFEPTVSWELSQGPDLLCFSGDKLLGASQAGIIIGKKELIAKLRKDPLMRMVRVDKVAYYLLQKTLLHYVNKEHKELPLWKMIFQKQKDVNNRINRLLRGIDQSIKPFVKKTELFAAYGGGSMPGTQWKTKGITIEIPQKSPQEIYNYFIDWHQPVMGIITENRFVLNFHTVFDEDIIDLKALINSLKDII